MILGMSLATFTAFHVVLSLIGIGAGLVVLIGMLGSKRLPGWTALFLVTTILTSVTGFLFPSKPFGAPHLFGVISLVALAVALLGLYGKKLAGPWRWLYVGTALLSLYLNVFVGVVQAFQKLAPLNRLAPTQSEPPFAIAQLVVLALFVVLGIRAVKRFHPAPHP
jgi:hypothetical protein